MPWLVLNKNTKMSKRYRGELLKGVATKRAAYLLRLLILRWLRWKVVKVL